MNNRVEVADNNISVNLLKIPGKKKYFLQTNNVLITKLVAINKKRKKKLKEGKDYTIIPLQGNKEEFVVHPRKLKKRDCNVPKCFYSLTKYNQYNLIVPRGKFLFFYIFNMVFTLNELYCLCHYFIELHPPTADALGLLCGLFQFHHKLAGPKKSSDEDEAFNLYDFCLYGLHCTILLDVQEADCMKSAVE